MVDVGVAYHEDVDEVFARILEDVDLAGVENWADSAPAFRIGRPAEARAQASR